jgi:spore coat-associated protein N
MADDKPTLTRRRVLGGMATIGAAGAVGAGTWAAFSDEESATGSATAGTLDLKVENTDISGRKVTLGNGDLAPGDDGSYSNITLKNTGNVAGELRADLNITSAQENDRNEAETADDPNSGGNGELDNVLELQVPGQNSGWRSLRFYDENTPYTLANSLSDSKDITIKWRVPEDADNSIQSDSVTFDVTFTLEQQP